MQELIINVGQVEDYQTIKNIDALDALFTKARSTIVNGESVVLARKGRDGRIERFDTLTTLDDLDNYRDTVYKYL
ncbi:MAG: hypothetical protein JWP27_987 [Flaviaesturariibacter sp.]|nr:hypothetical protein [Flaviaesturariibacter sp.]